MQNATIEESGGSGNETVLQNGTYVQEGAYRNATYGNETFPGLIFGKYNYCNMPHVRPETYEVPQGYTLDYVEVIHRHHKRTPYASNLFPKEDILFECRGRDYYYADVADCNLRGDPAPPSRLFWDTYVDNDNPFAALNSTCQFPQITEGGLLDAIAHGTDLARVYRDKLGFLPVAPDNSTQFFATTNVISSHTLLAVMLGEFPWLNGSHVVNVQEKLLDYLEPAFLCPGGDTVKKNITTLLLWARHLQKSQGLYERLDHVTGVDPLDAGWHSSFDHYFDSLLHRVCHGLPFPTGIKYKEVQQVFHNGHWEYNNTYRGSSEAARLSLAKYGVFVGKLSRNLAAKAANQSEVAYRHSVAHDGSVAPLLGILGAQEILWPGMGAEVVFEMWLKAGELFVRVLYGGEVLKTEGGALDMVPLPRFLSRFPPHLAQASWDICTNNSSAP